MLRWNLITSNAAAQGLQPERPSHHCDLREESNFVLLVEAATARCTPRRVEIDSLFQEGLLYIRKNQIVDAIHKCGVFDHVIADQADVVSVVKYKVVPTCFDRLLVDALAIAAAAAPSDPEERR